MGEFLEGSSCLEPSSSFMAMDSSLELNGTAMEINPSLGLMCYPDENCSSHQPEFSMAFVRNPSSFLPVECLKPNPVPSAGQQIHGEKKATAASANKKEALSVEAKTEKKNGCKRVKRLRSSSKEVDNPKEVVHVRARRGQATDSHILAERVRRKKINERMQCLQGLVPGCHKAIGMASVLDEIINYVKALQNQVAFLSMRLAAASSFYDNSLDMMEGVATGDDGSD